MSFLKTVIVIFATFCSHFQLQVNCQDHTQLTKYYSSEGLEMIRGKHQLNGLSLAYAICETSNNNQKISCFVTMEPSVLDDSKQPYTCEITLKSHPKEKKIYEILEVNVWSHDLAVLIWRSISHNGKKEEVVIKTIHGNQCASSDQAVPIRDSVDTKREIFFLPYYDKYDIFFLNSRLCPGHYCKLTVDRFGNAYNLVTWIPNTGLIHDVKIIDYKEQRLIVLLNRETNKGSFYLKYESRMKRLMEYESIEGLVWSTTRGFISICSCISCTQLDDEGTFLSEKRLQIKQPCRLYSIYNLMNSEQLAVLHDGTENDYYRIAKIDKNGNLGHTLNLHLRRGEEMDLLNSQFFMKTNLNYCLALFHDVPYDSNNYQSFLDCFSLNYLQ